ncbi:MAG TPA: response regulator transcription factor [Anaerolineales bacterium]|nr:response regulator transcription factor [Anaerolineales bacterium]
MSTAHNKLARVLIVDDHELFRQGIANLVNEQSDMEIVGEAKDGLEAYYRATALKPDLILLDINMPDMDGLEAIKRIRADLPECIVVMLTVHEEDEKLFKSIRAGAKGYVLKNAPSSEFLKMCRQALSGEAALSAHLSARILTEFARESDKVDKYQKDVDEGKIDPLTMREKEVLSYASQGMTNREIARHLTLSVHTVKSHIRSILAKLNVDSRYAASDYAKHTDMMS